MSELSSSGLGLTHIISGNGKGKTSAAVGMAIRAAGSGLAVTFVQFMKADQSHEVNILKHLPRVTYYSPGRHGWVHPQKQSNARHRSHAIAGLEYVLSHCAPSPANGSPSRSVQLLVCDEILNVPLFSPADPPFSFGDIVDLIRGKRDDLELVLTGYACPDAVTAEADYASVINEVKHPFREGIPARKGIEF
ncbi:MAG: cob(I)yrinic acid a,c-diamide adenosyltransferase [Desulfobacterales bacterium]|nr:cob(I)yrinic acid a,c-diamide adenosyltransferase [Desulfobacterales bacterium]